MEMRRGRQVAQLPLRCIALVVLVVCTSLVQGYRFPTQNHAVSLDMRGNAMLEARLVHLENGPLNINADGAGDPEANPNGSVEPTSPKHFADSNEDKAPDAVEDDDDNGSDLEAPNYLPPLKCKREEWKCSCVRECKCDNDEDVVPYEQLQIPLIRNLYEEQEGIPAGIRCHCSLSQCECLSSGSCDNPHKGDHMLNFVGGLLEVENPKHYVFNGNAKFTVEAWIHLPSSMPDPSRVRCLLSRFNYGVSGQLRIWMKDYQLMAQRETQDNLAHRVISGPIPCCQWVHMAVVYTGRNLVLLINGAVVSMRSSGEVFEDSRSKLLIGGCMSEGRYVRAFSGAIDDVRIWNVARTKEDIQENMYKRIDPYSIGLAGYWRCNLGTGTVVADQTRNKMHAKIIGTVVWEPSMVPIHKRMEDANKFKPEADKPSCGLPNLTLNPPGNMALGMPSTHSSQCCGGDPGRAVDGVRDPNYGARHCSHTAHDYEPWWRLDFGTDRPVATVKVLNRADCCWDRLNGFEVFVGNDKNNFRTNKVCGGRNSIYRGGDTTVTCNPPIQGRYLFVAIRGRFEYLTICGVEAYAPPETTGGYIMYQMGKCGEPRIFYKSVRINSDPGGAVQIRNALYQGSSSQGTCQIENAPLDSKHANQALCPGGTTTRFGQQFLIKFYEPAGNTDWTFFIRLDAGWGLGAFLDGHLVMEVDSDVYAELEIKLSKVSQGGHALEVFGAEGCCDGNRGGWEFERSGSGRKPLTLMNLMTACSGGSGPMVTFFKGPGCTGGATSKPKGLSMNLCEHRFDDGSGMNDAVRSARAPAGTQIDFLQHCGPSSVVTSLSFSVDNECLEVGDGVSYVRYGADGCTKPGFEVCSAKQLRNAINMGYYDPRWARIAEGVEGIVTGKCSGNNCLEEVVPIRAPAGASTWCCETPEFLKFVSGPVPAKEVGTKCSQFGGMYSPCSFNQLKSAETIGFRKCAWGRFSESGRDVAVCGSCGPYAYREGECAMDTLRTTPRPSDNQGIYCCHLACS